MKCSNCGHELKDGASFCENCGMIFSSNNDRGPSSARKHIDNSAEFDAILGEDLFGTATAKEAVSKAAEVNPKSRPVVEKPQPQPEPQPKVEPKPVEVKPQAEPEPQPEVKPQPGPAAPVEKPAPTVVVNNEVFEEDPEDYEDDYPENFEDITSGEQQPYEEPAPADNFADEYPEDEYIPSNDDGEEMLVTRKSRSKGTIIASVAVVLLVAIVAGAMSLKNGGKIPFLDNILKSKDTTSETESSVVSESSSDKETSIDEFDAGDSTTKKSKKSNKDTSTTEESTTAKSSKSGNSSSGKSSGSSSSSGKSSGSNSTSKRSSSGGSSSTTGRSYSHSSSGTTKASTTKATTTEKSTTKATTTKETTTKEKVTKATTTKESTTKEKTTTKATTTTEATTKEKATTKETTTESTTKEKVTKKETTTESTTKEKVTKATTTESTTKATTTTEAVEVPTWPKAKIIKALGFPAMAQTIQEPEEYSKSAYVVYANVVNGVYLRATPEASGKTVSLQRQGKALQVIAEEGEWILCYSSYYNQYGWINSKYVTENAISQTKATAPDKYYSNVKTKTATEYVKLRVEPSADSKNIQTFAPGDKFEVLGYMKGNDTYVYVKDTIYGYTGWMTAEYLK